ncbi:MAG TPA: hypothetical protein ENN38_01260 [Actinobacteria bacterium]|nr:hypothetical protein [Actinomycetota bacterium]
MGCPSFKTLSFYLDEELRPQKMARIAEHLERCELCRVKLKEFEFEQIKMIELSKELEGIDYLPPRVMYEVRKKKRVRCRMTEGYVALLLGVIIAIGALFIPVDKCGAVIKLLGEGLSSFLVFLPNSAIFFLILAIVCVGVFNLILRGIKSNGYKSR